ALGVGLVGGELGALGELLADLGEVAGHGGGDADHEVLGGDRAAQAEDPDREQDGAEPPVQAHRAISLDPSRVSGRSSRPRATTRATARVSASRWKGLPRTRTRSAAAPGTMRPRSWRPNVSAAPAVAARSTAAVESPQAASRASSSW